MLDHINIRVADYERSKKFYAAAQAPLGYRLAMEVASGAGFSKEFILLEASLCGSLQDSPVKGAARLTA